MTRDPVLRVAPQRSDLNNNGHIFGGWVLSQMDIAAGITAANRARGQVATVAIDAMTFLRPILIGDLISVYTEITRVGRTSITINIEVLATRPGEPEEIKVTEGTFTFVAIDEHARPREVDPK